MQTATMNAHKDIPGNPSTAKSSRQRLNDRNNGQPLRVLSDEDWNFWITNSYVIIKNAVPAHTPKGSPITFGNTKTKTRKICQPGTGGQYRNADERVEQHRHGGDLQSSVYVGQQAISPYPSGICRYLGTEKLWVTIDRANLNFPIRPGFEYKGFIHWDYDPETKLRTCRAYWRWRIRPTKTWRLQCIPELFRTYDSWKLTQPANRDHFKPDPQAR